MRTKLFVAILLFCFFSNESNIAYSQERFMDTIIKVSDDTAEYKDGSTFSGGDGQCADFVKEARADVQWGSVGNAANMISIAEEKGLEVNKKPRVGAIIIMPDVSSQWDDGEKPAGHAAIITKIEKTKDGVYTLTIKDANANGDWTKKNPTSTVDERTIKYNVSDKGIPTVNDLKLGEQKNVAFIHENKKVYDGLARTYEVKAKAMEAKTLKLRREKMEALKVIASNAAAEAEDIASLKNQFIETLKGIPKAFDDLEHGRLEGILPQTLYDVSTSLLQTIAAVTPAGFSLSLSDLEKMQKTLDSTRSVANLDPGHPDLNVPTTNLVSASTSAYNFSDNFAAGLGNWSAANAFTASAFGSVTSPDGSAFAIVHTGPGTAASTGLLSKEIVLGSTKNITFNFKYNFISTEFLNNMDMDFEGSGRPSIANRFKILNSLNNWPSENSNDSFTAELHTPGGDTIALSSVNVQSVGVGGGSKLAPEGVIGLPNDVIVNKDTSGLETQINPNGGMSGWQSNSITVSVPAGISTLHFHVTETSTAEDVNAARDSAVAIDNVSLEE